MKRIPPILTVLILISIAIPSLHAQPGRGARPGAQGAVRGSVIGNDTEGEIPLEGATVALWRSSDSTLVTGAIARNDGSFTIDGLPPGAYYINVSYLGFATDTRDVAIANSVVDVGRIVLQPSTDETGEVTVDAERNMVEMRSDRTVYNVEGQAVTAGGNALDVLKNVPSVEVDVNDNVSLRGNQNVAVLINNRPVPVSGDMLASFLKGLPSDAITSVEVIPNPSARYDPDGMAGILNINLKKNDEAAGVGGSINVGGSTREEANLTGSLNLRSGETSLFTTYGFNYGTSDGIFSTYRENRLFDPPTFLDQSSESNGTRRSHFLNMNLDYSLADDHTLSLAAVGSLRGGIDDETIDYTDMDGAREVVAERERYSLEHENEKNLDLTLAYRWVKETARHELSAEASFEVEEENEESSFAERLIGPDLMMNDSVLELQRSDAFNTSTEGSFQVDYVRPLGEQGRLELGYKGEMERLDNDLAIETFDVVSDSYRPDGDLSRSFLFDEQIHAGYAIVAQQFGKFEATAGLRAEQALTDFSFAGIDSSFSNDYFSLFPSASAMYRFDESRQVRASYSKRIRRPRTGQLDPVPRYDDPLNLRIGNPNLKPEYTHAFEVGYNQYVPWGTFSFTPYYRYTTNSIERYLTVDSNNVATSTFANLATNTSYGASAVATFRLGKRFNGFLNLDAYRAVTNGSNLDDDLSNDAFGWSGRANVSSEIIDGLEAQVSYFYRPPMDISGGRIEAMHGADVALKKELFDERASVTLRMSDPFNTRKFSFRRETDAYYTEASHQRVSRSAWLTFSWSFGSQTKDRNRRRMEGGDDGGGMDEEF